uniref:glutathione transferase n=1 Tax=Ganoderma boninense TaxID=34458 RepID=A0A5K1JX07_9APHY|nr:Putative non-ribosomal peptide ligase/ polyketide synthase hybrid [Ganoderma boninense]
MVLTLYGNVHSTCTARVRTVLEELSLAHEFVEVDFSKPAVLKSPEVLAVQPFGQIPYIDDAGFKLFESRAICRYLALKYGGVGKGLVPDPSDREKTALFDQAASIEVSNFDPPASGLGFENIVKQYIPGLEADPAMVAKYKFQLEQKMEGYDRLLSRQKFMAGDELTIIDLFHLPWGAMLKRQGNDILESDKFPNVKSGFHSSLMGEDLR